MIEKPPAMSSPESRFRDMTFDSPSAALEFAYAQHQAVYITFKDGRPPLRGRVWKLNENQATINFTGREGGGEIALADIADIKIEK